MPITSNLLIIGGGPAGLAIGIGAARCGIDAIVLEKQAYPIHKACGEGIMPAGVRHLCHFGIDRYLHSDDIYPFDGIRYISPHGTAVEACFSEDRGWGVERARLSSALANTAGQYPGLQLHTNCKVNRLEQTRAGWIARAGDLAFQADLVVGADGLNSITRPFLGNPPQKGRRQRWGIRQHFAIPPWSRFVEVYWSNGIEAYVTPVSSHAINLAFLFDRAHFHRTNLQVSVFQELLGLFPQLSKRLKDVQSDGQTRAIGPLDRPVQQTTGDGMILAGDSAGYVDALTGEGVSLALGTAHLFEQLVIPLLISHPGQMPSKTELEPFAAQQATAFRNYARFARLALLFSEHPLAMEQAIRVLSRRPGLFQLLLSGNQAPQRIPPGRVLQALLFASGQASRHGYNSGND